MPDDSSAPGAAQPRFSVIIPAYNARPTLRWCLEGVMEQAKDEPFEVIVVESGEGSYIPALAGEFPDAVFVLPPGRLFSGQARNAGVRFARGSVLVFLDCDCRPLPGWLAALAEGFERGFEVVCGALENGTPESLAGTAEHLLSHRDCAPQLPPREIKGSTASSGNLSILKKVFEEHGGFGGTFRAVDFALSARLNASGTAVLFQPEAVVLHRNTAAAGVFLSEQVQRGYWAAVNRVRFGSRGAVVSRFPPLALLLFPLRFYRFMKRSIRYRLVSPLALAKVTPLATAGLLAWTLGFFGGAIEAGKVQPEEGKTLPYGWADFELLSGSEAVEGRWAGLEGQPRDIG